VHKEEKKMTVREVLENMKGGASILYIKNIKGTNLVLSRNMIPFCNEKLLDMKVKNLDAGDIEMKGNGLVSYNAWSYSDTFNEKFIICTYDEEKE
jgi:hypothetical protein